VLTDSEAAVPLHCHRIAGIELGVGVGIGVGVGVGIGIGVGVGGGVNVGVGVGAGAGAGACSRLATFSITRGHETIQSYQFTTRFSCSVSSCG
jgi:hypothetical protein